MKFQKLFSTLACGGLWLALQCTAQAAAPSVSLDQTREALDKSSAVVVDIREPSEQATGVAKGARLIPMGQLENRMGEVAKSKADPIILICATQNRSAKVAEILQTAGYTHVSYVQGGMKQWTARGLPLAKP